MSVSEDNWEAAQEGAERIADGDPEGAVAELEELVQRDPDNEYAFFFLGSAHFELGNFAKAMKAYVSALGLKPEYVGAMTNLGHTLRLLGRYREAIRMGHQVLARAKHDGDALYLIGASHYAMGDGAAALKYLEQFLETSPEIEVATEVRGMIEALHGRIEPAEVEN